MTVASARTDCESTWTRPQGQGRLAEAEDGTVIVPDGACAAGPAAGVEQALIEAAGISRSERVGKPVARAAASREVRSVGDRLQAQGLLIRPVLRRGQYRARRLPWWSAALAPVPAVERTTGTADRWWAGAVLSVGAAVTATLVKPAQARVPYRAQSTLGILRGGRLGGPRRHSCGRGGPRRTVRRAGAGQGVGHARDLEGRGPGFRRRVRRRARHAGALGFLRARRRLWWRWCRRWMRKREGVRG
ncbi:hypothetical protein AB0E62_28985 [Streptomyces sp. NPDC038707]|uniref:hypothetical protein n=1 Tax=Streptomyces sp. NPDC038707 TaxID=3154329 RepID=UPI0033FCF61D